MDPTKRASATAARIREFGKRPPWELGAALLVQFLMIVPVVRTGFESDDHINSTTEGALHVSHLGWWDLSTTIAEQWIHGPGRWFPLGFYWGYGQWALINDVLLYKWMLVGYALLASIAVWALMRELGADRAVAALVVVGVAVVAQFRLYPDPHVSFGGLTQSVTIMLAGAMICFQRWLVGGRWFYLAGCLALTAIAASTYEAVYLFAPLFVLQAIRERSGFRAILRASVGPLLLTVAFVMLGAYLRSHGTDGDAGPYAPSWDLGAFLNTFIDQFSGAVPLTYAVFDPSNIFTGRLGIHPALTDVLVGAAVAVASAFLLSRVRMARWSPLQTFSIGLAFWMIVAASLALAKRYQAELVPGLAHVPVYFEEVALAITAASIVGLAWQHLPFTVSATGRRILIVGGALSIGLLATAQHRANDRVVEAMAPTRELRALEDQALQAGLLNRIDNGSRLYVTGLPWHQLGYYWMFARRDVNLDFQEFVAAKQSLPPSKQCSLDNGRGSAILNVQQLPGDIHAGMVAVGCAKPTPHAAVFLRNIDVRDDRLTGQTFAGKAIAGSPSRLLRGGKHGIWTPRDRNLDVRTLIAAPAPSVPDATTTNP